jgi:hypothetical protein
MPQDSCYNKFAAKMPNSARRSQLIAKCRKASGNVRKTEEGNNLKRWGKEQWVDKISGKACGTSSNTEYCRPSKKVSNKTPNMPSGKKLKQKIQEKKQTGMGNKISKATYGGLLYYKNN